MTFANFTGHFIYCFYFFKFTLFGLTDLLCRENHVKFHDANMHAVVIAVLVLQLLESSECNGSEVSCTCPNNPNFEVTCTRNTWKLCVKECFNERLCCRYNASIRGVVQSEIGANGRCTLLEDPRCNNVQPPPSTCRLTNAASANCRVMCTPVIDYEDTTVSSSTPITADNTTLATAPAASTAPATSPPTAPATSLSTATTSSQHTPTTTSSHPEHTDSTGNAQEIQDAEDDAFPVATAVTVPVAFVAVAAITVAVILRCRYKNTSKGDPDINDRPIHNGVMISPLGNPSYNQHDIVADVAPNDTEYAECGPIDECLKPVGHRVRQELGNKPGKTPLEGDPYDHVRQDGRSITRDPNYAHLDMDVLDKEYSHIIGVGEINVDTMDNGRIADINTYNHLGTNLGTASDREPSIPTEYDQKGQYPGNVYMTLQRESQQTVPRGDYEKVTTDHCPHEYVQLEKGECDVAETTAEYTDLLGAGNGTSSPYQTLEATVDTVDDRIKLNGSPVIADTEDRTSVSHDYWQLVGSGEGSNGNLVDAGIADVNSNNHLETTVENTQARGNGMRTECNQEISPDMTKDIHNGQCPGNVYMTLGPEAHPIALKGDYEYEQATADYMPHDYVQLEKGESGTAETAVEYTGLLNADNRISSEYQTLEPTADPINNIIERSESPVIADAQYFTLTSK